MKKSIVQRLLTELTFIDFGLWGIAFLLILAALGWALVVEKRVYQARGKGGSWWWLRLLSLPILILTAVAVVVPARSISGMEALAVFYLALFSLGPIIWFGLHWLVGAIVSPRLSGSESITMALTGLALLFVPAAVISMLQGPLFRTSHLLNEHMFTSVERVALAHEVQPIQRLRLGQAGEIYAQTLRAPAGVRIERVDALIVDHWANTKTMTHPYLCRQGDDVHLAWPAGSVPPPLRMFWRDSSNARRQTEFRVDHASAEKMPAKNFMVGWRDDGVDLPVPISRDIVQLGWIRAADHIAYRTLDSLQPGENFDNNCVMTGYRRVAWRDEGPIAALKLRFHPRSPAAPWQYEIMRMP